MPTMSMCMVYLFHTSQATWRSKLINQFKKTKGAKRKADTPVLDANEDGAHSSESADEPPKKASKVKSNHCCIHPQKDTLTKSEYNRLVDEVMNEFTECTAD